MYNTQTITSNYTVADNIRVILANNTTTAITITLPNATRYRNRMIWIKRFDPTSTGNLTINSSSGNVQDPFLWSFVSSTILNFDVEAIGYVSDGTIWHVYDVTYTEALSIQNKTASYTLQLTDRQTLIEMNVSSGNIVTVPQVAFQPGTQILIVQAGTGQTTVSPASGVTLLSNGNKFKLSGQYALATLIYKSGFSWYLGGDLTV